MPTMRALVVIDYPGDTKRLNPGDTANDCPDADYFVNTKQAEWVEEEDNLPADLTPDTPLTPDTDSTSVKVGE